MQEKERENILIMSQAITGNVYYWEEENEWAVERDKRHRNVDTLVSCDNKTNHGKFTKFGKVDVCFYRI